MKSIDIANSLPPPRLKPLSGFVLSALAVHAVGSVAAEAEQHEPALQLAQTEFAQVEFDSGFGVNGSGRAVDLSRFGRGNVVAAGDYNVDLYVGDSWVGRYDVPFRSAPGTPDAQPCFNRDMLFRIGIDFTKLPADVLEKIGQDDACLRIGQVVSDASPNFDLNELRLTLSIPQASLKRDARGAVSPDQWNAGVPVAMLGYNANVYRSKSSGSAVQTDGYVGLTSGINIGNWHFRHNGSYSWSGHGENRYQDIATYVQRDLPALTSQLLIGESYTSGELFDSTGFRGVQLSSDDRMLPDSLRGYAPVVRGVANSNAKVTIRQNGTTIYETTVAPGAFVIDDLYPTGYGGDLQVAVTEADGSVHSFAVPYAAVPLSLRPGRNRYSFVAGQVRNQQLDGHAAFAQATWQHGFNNLLTGYAGVSVSQGYAAAMIGAAFNTKVGAFGADVTQAMTSVPGAGRFNGSSIRVSYSKSIPATRTDIALAAYRYSTSGYFGLNDAVLTRDRAKRGESVDSVWRQRNRASLTLSQNLGDRRGQLSVTASAANYWNRPGSDTGYTAGYSNSFRNISYSISASRQRSPGGEMSTMYYASVSIPLGKSNPVTVSTNFTRDTAGRTQVQSTLSGVAGPDRNLSYSVSANHASGNGTSSTDGSGNLTYRGSLAELNVSAGGSSSYQQASIGMRGALVAHSGGVTLSQPLSDTFAIVEAPGATGARVTNASGVRIDGRGYAIVPYLTPYTMNTVELDPKGLSTDVELKETSVPVVPRAGAVPMIRFATASGRSALIRARQSDGQPVPFGAEVRNEAGKAIGVVGQAGKIFARGLADEGTLEVVWGEGNTQGCAIAYDLPPRKNKAGFQQFTGVCKTVVSTSAGL
ncbi:fimbria/pilus outer membrane usher protein [Burkholderia cenocepacia]|uniref:fimbria/pilus outer membrane usher protein n=1 Tax=Burkholderia cenocepacia TaxID=95486 RepID=UPI00265226F9|nr:fimbria/pilus outer membrane usher protein [Burkholderia cenocepacia]MDN7452322.1 fimbria/pilus outer membrane usher protein [Burkholderia cenocepacia]